jgi:hypothetical protein
MHIPTIDSSLDHVLIIDGKRHKGRLYNVGGKAFEVYKVKTLAEALGKTTAAIEKWEIYGWFPKPLFYVRSDRIGICRRWYSREQILNLHDVICALPYGRGNGHRHYKDQFFKTVRAVFAHRVRVKVKGTPHVIERPKDRDPVGIPAGTPDDGQNHGAGSQDRVAPKRRASTDRSQRPAAPKYSPSIRE